MKIGLVCPYIYPENGGVAQHVRFLYENLRLRGHDVRIITASHGPQRSSEGDIIRLGVGFSVPINASVGTLTFSPRYLTQIDDMLERERFDLLHFHEPFVPFLSLFLLRESTERQRRDVPRLRRLLAVVRVRQPGPAAAMPRRLHGRIAVSAAARHFIDRYFPGDYKVIPNGVDIARYANAVPLARWQDGTPNVLFVGRHEPRKGLLDLLKAHRILRKTGSGIALLVVGSGPQEREARRYVATRGLQGVEFLGRVSDAEKAQLFRTADVYASPATGGESFGIVLLEAMAAGHADRVLRHPRLQGRRPARPRGPARAAARAARAGHRDRSPAARPGAARADGRGRPGARRGVQLAAGDGQGRRLLRVRHPPPGGRRERCRAGFHAEIPQAPPPVRARPSRGPRRSGAPEPIAGSAADSASASRQQPEAE